MVGYRDARSAPTALPGDFFSVTRRAASNSARRHGAAGQRDGRLRNAGGVRQLNRPIPTSSRPSRRSGCYRDRQQHRRCELPRSGTATPGLTRGFGAVFTDVDLADTTSLTFLRHRQQLSRQLLPLRRRAGPVLSGVDFGSAACHACGSPAATPPSGRTTRRPRHRRDDDHLWRAGRRPPTAVRNRLARPLRGGSVVPRRHAPGRTPHPAGRPRHIPRRLVRLSGHRHEAPRIVPGAVPRLARSRSAAPGPAAAGASPPPSHRPAFTTGRVRFAPRPRAANGGQQGCEKAGHMRRAWAAPVAALWQQPGDDTCRAPPSSTPARSHPVRGERSRPSRGR
jgi:hypothetical protein